jgi:hypothetical protein
MHNPALTKSFGSVEQEQAAFRVCVHRCDSPVSGTGRRFAATHETKV